jgi:hypothetical protein
LEGGCRRKRCLKAGEEREIYKLRGEFKGVGEGAGKQSSWEEEKEEGKAKKGNAKKGKAKKNEEKKEEVRE